MREMKYSGIEWIGTIPVDWEMIRTKNRFRNHKDIAGNTADSYERLALTLNGVIKRSKEDSTGLQPEAFNGYQILRTGELVFKLIDLENVSTSRVGLSPFTGIVSPAYIVLTPLDGINVSYAQYFFLSMWQREIFNHMGDDGVRSSLNSKDLLNIPLTCPSLEEQERIAIFLDRECSEIDTLISCTRDSIAEYKKLKQAVISRAVTKGIRGDRAMKESGIKWANQIPAEWNSINPKALFTQRKDKARPGERQLTASQQHGVIYQDEYMALTGSKVVTVEKDFDILKHVEAGDFVISMRSFQGGLEYSTNTGSISSAYVMLIPNLELVEPRFFKWLLKSSVYINALQSTSNLVRDGQAMRYSNFAQVRLYTVPMDEQREIADYLDRKCADIDRLIAQKEQFLTEIENYKKTLIYEYVTGKKEVPMEQTVPVVTFLDARALLVCRIVELMKPKGRIHLQKAMHMVDCLLGLNNETQYSRHKHGPYDVRIQEYEQAAEKKGWIKVKQGSSVEYSAGAKLEEYRAAYLSLYGVVDAEIQRICTFLAPMKTSQSERVATLLAAWNDFLLDGVNPTDQQLIHEVRTNWTPNKANSPEETWLDTLNKIRKNGFVPAGKGLRTITAD